MYSSCSDNAPVPAAAPDADCAFADAIIVTAVAASEPGSAAEAGAGAAAASAAANLAAAAARSPSAHTPCRRCPEPRRLGRDERELKTGHISGSLTLTLTLRVVPPTNFSPLRAVLSPRKGRWAGAELSSRKLSAGEGRENPWSLDVY